MKSYKLFHHSILIAEIQAELSEFTTFGGTYTVTPAAEPFLPIFAYMIDKERDRSVEPPFDEDLLWNWFIEDDKGIREEVGLPGMYPDGTIYWRYF